MRIYFLDSTDRIRSAEWLECDPADLRQEALDRIGDYHAVEIWRQAEKMLRVERQLQMN